MSRLWLVCAATLLLCAVASGTRTNARQRTGIAGTASARTESRHEAVMQTLNQINSQFQETIDSFSPVLSGGEDMAQLDAVDAELDRQTDALQALVAQDLERSSQRVAASRESRLHHEKKLAEPRFKQTPTVASFPFPAGPAPFPADQPMAAPIVNGNDVVAAYPQVRPIHRENNNSVVDLREIETHDDLPPVSLPLFLGNKTVVARMEPAACVFPNCKENSTSSVPKELKGDTVVPHITRINPIRQDPTIPLVIPKPLVVPRIIEPPKPPCVGVCPPKPEPTKPEPLPLAPPLYDPLKVAQLHLAQAKDKLEEVGWVVNALKEPRNPSEHLIQQTIANIHKIEAKDLGPLAPGDQLQFEHKIKIEDAFMSSSANQQHLDGKSEELLGPGNVVTPGLDHLAWPQRMAKLFTEARALEIKRERQAILALQGRALPTDTFAVDLRHALFNDINSQEQRVKDRERSRNLGGKLESTLKEESEAAREEDLARGELSEESSTESALKEKARKFFESSEESSSQSRKAESSFIELGETKAAGDTLNPAATPPSKTLSQVVYDTNPSENSGAKPSGSESVVSASTTASVPATVSESSSEASEESTSYLPPLNVTNIQKLRQTSSSQLDTLRSHMDRLKTLMDDREAKEDVQALRGPQKIVVARALEKLGGAVDLLAGRIKDLDKMESNMFNKLFGKGHEGSAGTDEGRMIKERALAVKERKESEIAQLIRNEVRILTNQMRTELLMLKGAFFSSMRDLLYGLRKDLQDNFMRSRENDKKLLAIAMGQLPNGTSRLVDVLALKPVEEKEALTRSIGHKLNKAFNAAQNLEKSVVSARSKQAIQQEKLDRAQEAFDNEPSRKELDAAISLEASKHRNRADVTKDAEEHMLEKKGLMAKLLSDATAKQLRKQLMEEPDHGSDQLFTDDTDKHPLVKQAARIAKEREKKNNADSKSDAEKINSLREKDEEQSAAAFKKMK